MTAYSMTVTNTVRTFGGGPPSVWNAHNWNAFKWGEGTVTIPFAFVHLVQCANLGLDSARFFSFTKLVDQGSFALDSARSYQLTKQISNTLDIATDSAEQYLYDSNGYYHVFPGDVTDADERAIPTWSQGSAGSTSWTRQTASSTTWSAA